MNLDFPWTLNPEEGEIYDVKGALIARVAFRAHPDVLSRFNAVGLLIAAAPTLLNMVKWCVNHEGECLGDSPALLEAAREAIAELETT